MAQFVYTMNRVGKVVPPKREILKNISLSFFPGAKIGVLGLNGSGKSSLLRIMAGVDTEFNGEARPQPGINVGYLEQEPKLDDSKTVREVVEEAVAEAKNALNEYLEVRPNLKKREDYKKIFVPNSSLADILIEGLVKAGWEPET